MHISTVTLPPPLEQVHLRSFLPLTSGDLPMGALAAGGVFMIRSCPIAEIAQLLFTSVRS